MTDAVNDSDPINQATAYLRRLAGMSPFLRGTGVEVEHIETVSPGVLVLDLSDNTTIRLDISRYPRES